MIITETYYCPLDGDRPDNSPHWYTRPDPTPSTILIPGKTVPGPLTDAQAEHERAMYRAFKWDRDEKGDVRLWVDM